MFRKTRSAKAVPEPEKDSQEKRKSSIRWAEFETQSIVEWFCTRNENGVRVNYEAWTTGNHSDAAEKMLNQTGLAIKEGVTKRKATDKMVDMIKQYKDLRHKIDQSEYGTGLDGVDGISHEDRELQSGSCKTAKELIFKCCAWYYEYEELFCDDPGVNSPTLIESEQPTRRDSQIVNDSELGGYDKDLKEGESPPPDFGGLSDYDQDGKEDTAQGNEDKSDSFSLHSALLQIAQENRRVAKKQTKNAMVMSDDEGSLSLSEIEIPQLNQKHTTPKPRSISSKTTTRNPKSEKPAASHHTKNTRTKQMRSNSPDSSERENSLRQARQKRRNKTQLSMAQAMVKKGQILDQREKDAAKLNDERHREITQLNDQRERDLAKDAQKIQELRFQAEMRQRDQHHELEVLRLQAILNQGQAAIDQGKERLLRLRASIQRQMPHTLTPNHRVLPREGPNSSIDLDDLQGED